MHKVQGVSLPRCGHNLLVKHLQTYFDSSSVCPDYRKTMLPFIAKAKMRRFSESPTKNSTPSDKPFHYCEYYYSCRSIPCCNAVNSFQKSHDFELDISTDPDQKYIVQTRNHLGLLISWFELRLPRQREVDSPEGFVAFAKRMQPYLNGFRKKWVESALKNRVVIDYDDYLRKPVYWLQMAIELFDDSARLDRNRLIEIVSDVKPAKDNSSFRYYDFAVASGLFESPRKMAS